MAQQTAVEWLAKELETYGDPQVCKITWKDLDSLIEQAKQMEKEQQLELIQFVRMQDKMGKSIEDLYNQYKHEYGNKS